MLKCFDSNFVQYFASWFSPLDRVQIVIILGTKQVVYQKLKNLMQKKNICVNRLKSAISDMLIVISGMDLTYQKECKRWNPWN